VIGDGEGITVLAVAQQELAFVIGTPELMTANGQNDLPSERKLQPCLHR
jgi:hypothetical protein